MSRAPRVLVSGVVLGQPMGGVRRHNAELLPRAARLLAADGGALDVLEGREPVAFELPPEIGRRPSSVPAGPPTARASGESRALASALAGAAERGGPYDLVHTAHLPAPRRLGVPYTLTLHDLRSLQLPSAPFVRRLLSGPILGGAVRGAARVITVSEHVRADLIERFSLDPEHVRVVPNAADHLRVVPRAPGDDAPILAVGHLEPRKNLALLIRALAAAPELPDLVLAGEAKGNEEGRLRALAADLGVAERIRFLGAFEESELPELYATCACVVVPSLVEGFGLAALESQFAGAPLAIADAGALPEVAPQAPRFAVDDPVGCAAALRVALARSSADLERDRLRAGNISWDSAAGRLVDAWTRAF